MPGRSLPLIGIPSCVRTIHERGFHTVADKYPEAIIEVAECLPVLIPAVGPRTDCTALLDRLDGLLLTGSPSNVEPHHYGGPPSMEGTLHDPDRDATTLPLIREAVRRDMPILAICRGIQELNVALGGTLHQRIFEMPERFNHRRRRRDMTTEERYAPSHPVMLTRGGRLAELIGAAAEIPLEIMVNSLHGQGIDRPAAGLLVEAVAPDGQIEAVSLPGARFVVGVQWHPEYRAAENPMSRALFSAFAHACHATDTQAATNRRAA
jgi:putative glutamine amidotransferase